MRFLCAIALVCPALLAAQDRLPTYPKYEQWRKAVGDIQQLDMSLRRDIGGSWSADSKFYVLFSDKAIEVATGKRVDYKSDVRDRVGVGNRPGPGRGRQFTEYPAPDKKLIAKYTNGNIFLVGDATTKVVTTEGSAEARIKYGSASWVYGEELGQNEAMWWSADSKKLVFYRFDESKTPDYFVTLAQGQIQNKLYPEAYPKAGAPNPGVKLFCYDLDTEKTIEIDTRFPGADPNISEYIYGVRFAPDGKTLLYYRTNRQQNVLELCAADLSNGKSRVVMTDEFRGGWVDNTPQMIWLKDGQTFLWLSERNGFNNIYQSSLYNFAVKPITEHKFEVDSMVKVDEDRKEIWYYAHSAVNPNMVQLHRVGMDGKNEVILTPSHQSHTVRIAPDGSAFVDTAEALEQVRKVVLRDRNGREIPSEIDGLKESPYATSKYQPARRFVAKAADSITDIYGYYRLPSDFDPTRKYPVLLRVYGGPDSGSGRERFIGADAMCELGFVTAWVDGRGTKGRGRDFRESVYRKLGVVEIDDQAAAMRELAKLPFIDATKIGIEGTSYGGYASVMALLRHPDVFSAACASSSVTAWENYDSIYTERFMDTPARNVEGYKNASAMTYVANLKGKLCLFYGTADDNVHPSNTHQLIQALDKANKPYRLFVGVDQGHAGLRQDRMIEFFLEAFGLMR